MVLVSDVDEIVHPEVLATLRNGTGCLTGLEMPSSFRFANWMLPPGEFACAARAMPFSELEDPHHQRNHVKPARIVRDAGRHLTTLGDVDRLVSKFESYGHAEMDTTQQKAGDYLTRAQRLGVDVFTRELVSMVPPSDLCTTQRALLRRRPISSTSASFRLGIPASSSAGTRNGAPASRRRRARSPGSTAITTVVRRP